MMTRATFGHAGRELRASRGTQAIYLAIVIAMAARVAMAMAPIYATALMPLAAVAWIAAFAGLSRSMGRCSSAGAPRPGRNSVFIGAAVGAANPGDGRQASGRRWRTAPPAPMRIGAKPSMIAAKSSLCEKSFMAQTRHILIVDDDAEVRGALAEQLALHEEFAVSVAEDPRPPAPLRRPTRPTLS